MEFMDIFDDAITFAKDKIDTCVEFWDGLDSNKRRLLIGCVIGSVVVITLISIAFNLGKAKGRKLAFDEEDF